MGVVSGLSLGFHVGCTGVNVHKRVRGRKSSLGWGIRTSGLLLLSCRKGLGGVLNRMSGALRRALDASSAQQNNQRARDKQLLGTPIQTRNVWHGNKAWTQVSGAVVVVQRISEHIVLHCIALHCIVLYCILYCIVWCCTVVFCISVCCIIMHMLFGAVLC